MAALGCTMPGDVPGVRWLGEMVVFLPGVVTLAAVPFICALPETAGAVPFDCALETGENDKIKTSASVRWISFLFIRSVRLIKYFANIRKFRGMGEKTKKIKSGNSD
jgi:hypothetical protein